MKLYECGGLFHKAFQDVLSAVGGRWNHATFCIDTEFPPIWTILGEGILYSGYE